MTRVAARTVGGTVGLIRVLLLFESSLYSAVTPVLPHYAHTLHASKPAVGLLAASYTLGLLPGGVLGGWLAARLGVRRTTLAGLVVFAFAAAGFGFGRSLVTLDLLRIVQGVACGLIWGGGLTWVIVATPLPRRATTLGTVIAAATLGTLIGPMVGTLAVTTSTGFVFTAVGIVSLGLAALVHRHADPVPPSQAGTPTLIPTGQTASWRARLRSPAAHGLYLGGWMIMLEAMTLGATNALLPLRMSRFGASGVLIGAAFLGSGAVSAILAPLVGSFTDRRGPRTPLTIGLLLSAILIPALALPHSPVLLAILTVIALGAPMTGYMTPAMSTLTASAERLGIALVVATTIFNLAFAAGETIGAPLAAVVSQASSDAIPLIGLGVLMLLTLVPARRLRVGQLTAATDPAETVTDPTETVPAEDPRPVALPR
jgi:MFS family permease